MPTPSEQEVKESIKEILADYGAYSTTLNYAVNYCRAAMNLSGEALKVQCLYVLNNIPYWRGNGNRRIRQTLKDFIKGELYEKQK